MGEAFGEYELQKGDLDFLEGKVLVYCTHSIPGNSFPKYPALYFSLELGDVVHYTARNTVFDGGMALNVIGNFVNILDGFSYYGTAAFFEEFDEVDEKDGDVLHSGYIDDIYRARRKIEEAAGFYMGRYSEQLDSFEDAEDYHGREFVKKLWKYVHNLGKAVEERSEEKSRNVRREELELERFLRNSEFLPNLKYFINCVRENAGNYGLIDFFVELAGASHDGDAEEMLEKKRKLEKLLK